jgi:small subunit ribosomal protein S19
MSRSVWKPIITKKEIKNYSFNRKLTIIPSWVDKKINIHQGKNFIPLTIKTAHVGYKLGEFSFTKYPAKYKTKNG